MTLKEILLIIISLFVFGFILYFLIFQPVFPLGKKKIKEEEIKEAKYCTASLSLSSFGNGTCSITASTTTRDCNGKSYKIINNDTKCSGIIIDDSSIIICDWKVSSGNHTYKLYINDDYKVSGDIECPAEFVECIECICE